MSFAMLFEAEFWVTVAFIIFIAGPMMTTDAIRRH